MKIIQIVRKCYRYFSGINGKNRISEDPERWFMEIEGRSFKQYIMIELRGKSRNKRRQMPSQQLQRVFMVMSLGDQEMRTEVKEFINETGWASEWVRR